jgi:minimal PKS acyl carrier protein
MMNKAIEPRDLWRLLRESGGAVDADLDGEILDTEFDDLGYDSIALLETAAKITRDFGIPVDEEALAEATTPRLLLNLVNSSDQRETA